MKKFVCFLFCFLFIGVIGCEPRHYRITGINFTPVERQTGGGYYTVTEFKDEIIFQITGELEEQIIAEKINLNADSQCYAFQPGQVNDNILLRNTFSIIFDKPFTYADIIMEAGIDILQEPAFTNKIEIIGEITPHSAIRIIFTDTFSDNALFNDEYYNVTFSCKTSDGLHLQDEVTVKFPVK